MATCGRHTCSEQSLGYFLAQDYPSKVLLIYNNSEVPQELSEKVKQIDADINGTEIILVNQYLDSKTSQPYTNLGAIYRDAMMHIPADADAIYFWDDDDTFLPNHISQGVQGLQSTNAWAWKPGFSWMRYLNRPIEKFKNQFEPSVIIRRPLIVRFGFSETTTDQHMLWYRGISEAGKIVEDDDAEPTLIYDWSQETPTYKTSGDPNNPNNFANYRKAEQDHGDQVIDVIDPKKQYTKIKKLIKYA